MCQRSSYLGGKSRSQVKLNCGERQRSKHRYKEAWVSRGAEATAVRVAAMAVAVVVVVTTEVALLGIIEAVVAVEQSKAACVGVAQTGTQEHREMRKENQENTSHRDKQCAFGVHASTGEAWVCDGWRKGRLWCVVGVVGVCRRAACMGVWWSGAGHSGSVQGQAGSVQSAVQSGEWRACEGKEQQSQNMESEDGVVSAKGKQMD
ncbi:hypothetical protein E2C01_017845 [Portunus trituberculatus]|uniref:Uncharacterized protein n=1 Tax=Portunus trituberculatus TaxID=210409 RepID=A0A5B7DT14_PORTR|nr:hypothetical protein [Portunus trituberculatus]